MREREREELCASSNERNTSVQKRIEMCVCVFEERRCVYARETDWKRVETGNVAISDEKVMR